MRISARKPIREILGSQKLITGVDSFEQVVSGLLGPPGVIIATERAATSLRQRLDGDSILQRGWQLRILPSGEPTVEMVRNCAHDIQNIAVVNSILSVGGGSVIDAGKAIAYELVSPGSLTNLEEMRSLRVKSSLVLPEIYCLPTTIGSGAESSSASVLLNSRGIKSVLFGPSILPKLAILDPTMLQGSGTAGFTRSILDALGHGVESYLSRISNPGAEFLAMSAVNHILAWAAEEELDWSNETLLRLQLASNLAGQAQDKMLVGPAHALAHFNSQLAHGMGVGIFLRALSLTYFDMGGQCGERLMELLDTVRITPSEYIQILDRLLTEASSDGFEVSVRLPGPENVLDLAKDAAAVASPVKIDYELVQIVRLNLRGGLKGG